MARKIMAKKKISKKNGGAKKIKKVKKICSEKKIKNHLAKENPKLISLLKKLVREDSNCVQNYSGTITCPHCLNEIKYKVVNNHIHVNCKFCDVHVNQ
jgi:hypothetical protein